MSEAGVPETSLDLLAWRDALARAAPVPSAVDLAEWGLLLAGAGCGTEAAPLLDVAALGGGFSAQACADRQASVAGRPFGRLVPPAGDTVAARATAELRQLGHAIGAMRVVGSDAVPSAPPASPDPAHTDPAHADVAQLARRLRWLLEQPLAGRDEQLAATLSLIASLARRMSAFDHRAFAHAPLAVLASAVANVALTDFVLRTRDLWNGPAGSPALLHRVARLDAGGLGPYLLNVGGLARASRDVTAMARVAGDAAGADGPEPWIALLSRGCGEELLREVVDDLGDIAAGEALRAILEREAARLPATVNVALVMRLRDAGLDNADHALAVRAQQVVARLRPHSELEGAILGTIEAGAGRREAAAATFRRWLVRSPHHADLRERLDALQAGRFERFAITCGFGSPADRQATRLRRRGILPEAPRRRGERIDAVAVG